MPSPAQVAREVFDQASHPDYMQNPDLVRMQSRIAVHFSKAKDAKYVMEDSLARLYTALNLVQAAIDAQSTEEALDNVAWAVIYLMQYCTATRTDFALLLALTVSDNL